MGNISVNTFTDTLSRTELYIRRDRSLQKAEKNAVSISW
jgi:hypothetical protein